MKRLLTLALVAAMTGSVSAQKQRTLHSGYPIDPVPFTSVKVTDSFWGQRLKASREVTIPLAFSKCEETGRYENFCYIWNTFLSALYKGFWENYPILR